jgi:hypothetical protein
MPTGNVGFPPRLRVPVGTAELETDSRARHSLEHPLHPHAIALPKLHNRGGCKTPRVTKQEP